MIYRQLKSITIVTTLVALGGCAALAPQSQVSDILKNKQAYIDSNFSPKALSAEVTAPFDKIDAATPNFKTLTLTFEFTGHPVNPPPDKPSTDLKINEVTHITHLGGGYMLNDTQMSSNGIPYEDAMNLTYLGFAVLRDQSFNYNSKFAGPFHQPEGISNITKDLAHPVENASYGFDEHAGTFDYSFQCQSGKFYPASTIVAKLSGNALTLDCTFSKQGIVVTRSKLVYLTVYATYVIQETDSSTTNNVFKLVDVTESN